jgi:hypothetical protein
MLTKSYVDWGQVQLQSTQTAFASLNARFDYLLALRTFDYARGQVAPERSAASEVSREVSLWDAVGKLSSEWTWARVIWKRAAVQMDLSIVFCCNPSGKTEAEPRTTLMLTSISLNPIKPFEDSSLLIERYPDARVL